MRRKLKILAIIIAIIGLGVFVYLYFFASKATITVTPGGGLPIAGQGVPAVTDSATSAVGEPVPVTARLVKVSVGPVVQGEAVTDVIVASSSPVAVVKYIERQSGNVYSYNVGTGAITRTNNQTVPGIQSAAWLPDASMAFVRYLSGDTFSTINTYALPASSDSKQSGFFLSQNLSDIAVSSSSVLSLASGVNGSAASLGNIKDARTVSLFTSPLSALHLSFAGKSQYLGYTKPSAALAGFAYIIDSTGTFSRISGPKNGLVALASPSGKWALVSYVENGNMQLQLVETATGNTTALPIATIADKCVWAADDSSVYCGVPMEPPAGYAYPDDWYQGAVPFNDRIWKIEVVGRYAQLVLDFSKETDESLDAVALAIDPLNTMLVFVNKNDDSLWAYKL